MTKQLSMTKDGNIFVGNTFLCSIVYENGAFIGAS